MHKAGLNAARELLAMMAVVILITAAGCASAPVPAPAPAPLPLSPPQKQSITVNISALDIAFDKSYIAVPAGASVTIIFKNEESVAHNLAVYADQSAAKLIFRGETITGPGVINYQFIAPAVPGTYIFQCDSHPAAMNGRLVVTGSDCA